MPGNDAPWIDSTRLALFWFAGSWLVGEHFTPPASDGPLARLLLHLEHPLSPDQQGPCQRDAHRTADANMGKIHGSARLPTPVSGM